MMASERKTKENISNRERVNILATGYKLQGLYGHIPKGTQIRRQLMCE